MKKQSVQNQKYFLQKHKNSNNIPNSSYRTQKFKQIPNNSYKTEIIRKKYKNVKCKKYFGFC